MYLRKAIALALAALIVLAIAAACGGDDDGTSSGTFVPGPITCAPLEETSYAYAALVVLQVVAPAEPSPDVTSPRTPLRIESTIDAEVETPVRAKAHIVTRDGSNPTPTDYNTRIVDDEIWYEQSGAWRSNPRERDFDPIAYRPLSACAALAPALDTSLQEGVAEELDGVPTHRYDLSGLDAEFFARHRDFGGGSDAAVWITQFEGSAWVSDEHGFPVKLQLTGSGLYEDGSQLVVQLDYAVSRWNDDGIKVGSPQ